MAISKGYGNDTDNTQGWALAAGDVLTMTVTRSNLDSTATPVSVGIEVDSASTSVKIEVQITDHSTAHWYDLPGNDDITADKPVSIDGPIYGIRITATTDGCGVELKSEGASFTRVT